MYKLNKIREFLSINTVKNLYKTMALPNIEYGNAFLLNCTKY